jgi:hypothetical protein
MNIASPRGKRGPRASLRDEKEISAAMLCELMQEKVITGKLKMPSEEALVRLAAILEYWRQHYLAQQRIWPLEHEAHTAAAGLETALLKQREIYVSGLATAVKYKKPHVIEFLHEKVAAIDGVLKSLAAIYHKSIAIERVGSLNPNWKWLAGALPGDLTNALQSTNPGLAVGIGHNGPLVRFIAAVVPYLTGERPTPASIATQLKNRRQWDRAGEF